MKMQFFRMQAILANKLCGLVNLLQMPFTQDGFEPLYPLLKSKKLAGFSGYLCHHVPGLGGQHRHRRFFGTRLCAVDHHGHRSDLYADHGDFDRIRIQKTMRQTRKRN